MTRKNIRETITFSCEPEFKDIIIKKSDEMGYSNISQMIRDALQYFFGSEEQLSRIPPNDIITVIISVVYDHHDLKTQQTFTQLQHESNILFSFHFHMSHDECLENLIFSNTAKKVVEFIKNLRKVQKLKCVSIRLISRPVDSVK